MSQPSSALTSERTCLFKFLLQCVFNWCLNYGCQCSLNSVQWKRIKLLRDIMSFSVFMRYGSVVFGNRTLSLVYEEQPTAWAIAWVVWGLQGTVVTNNSIIWNPALEILLGDKIVHLGHSPHPPLLSASIYVSFIYVYFKKLLLIVGFNMTLQMALSIIYPSPYPLTYHSVPSSSHLILPFHPLLPHLSKTPVLRRSSL